MVVKCVSVGACGLYCGSCTIHLAQYRPELKRKLAAELGCAEDEVKCNGCQGLSASCWGRHCKIRLCAEIRGFEHCRQCPEMPCTRLRRLSQGYRDIPIRQLQEFVAMEPAAFDDLMQKRWTCNCGQPIAAYDNKCIECGNPGA